MYKVLGKDKGISCLYTNVPLLAVILVLFISLLSCSNYLSNQQQAINWYNTIATQGITDDEIHKVKKMDFGHGCFREGISALYHLKNEDLKFISEFKTLAYLDLSETEIDDRNLSYLKRLKNLKHLNIADTKITDAGFKDIARIKSLEYLCISYTKISDEGFKYIAKLNNLKELTIAGCIPEDMCTVIGDIGLLYVCKIKNIESLRFPMNYKITDNGIKYILKLNTIRFLDLSSTKVTDECLPMLKKISSLRYFNLNHTNITDSSVPDLIEMQQLIELRILQTKISSKGYTKIKKSLGNTKIFY